MKTYSARTRTGALLIDMPRWLWHLRPGVMSVSAHPWMKICNRNEKLVAGVDEPKEDKHEEDKHEANRNEASRSGYQCDWKWTSNLHLSAVFPVFGGMLYNRAMGEFPVSLQSRPLQPGKGKPAVSFIIGHRGNSRTALLLKTLESIAGQQGSNADCTVECIVVEQDNQPLVRDQLPGWVKYIHTPLPQPDMPYSRSRAFNAGVCEATADILVLHDNDMLIPSVFTHEVMAIVARGYEVINPKRFIFYLDKETSAQVCGGSGWPQNPGFDAIVQNLEGGGSVVITRQAYQEIGGFDEKFIGWGGEDNEFWERAMTRNAWPWGFLPILHLWHEAQPGKDMENPQGVSRYQDLSRIPPAERIRTLVNPGRESC